MYEKIATGDASRDAVRPLKFVLKILSKRFLSVRVSVVCHCLVVVPLAPFYDGGGCPCPLHMVVLLVVKEKLGREDNATQKNGTLMCMSQLSFSSEGKDRAHHGEQR